MLLCVYVAAQTCLYEYCLQVSDAEYWKTKEAFPSGDDRWNPHLWVLCSHNMKPAHVWVLSILCTGSSFICVLMMPSGRTGFWIETMVDHHGLSEVLSMYCWGTPYAVFDRKKYCPLALGWRIKRECCQLNSAVRVIGLIPTAGWGAIDQWHQSHWKLITEHFSYPWVTTPSKLGIIGFSGVCVDGKSSWTGIWYVRQSKQKPPNKL